MIKSFLNLIYISTLLFSSEQIILVVSDDFNASSAKMECYENGKLVYSDIAVNLGKNGVGWGLGEVILKQKQDEPLKMEGDKKAPIGVFKLTSVFGYDKQENLKMPYSYTSENLICVDDSNSKSYNKIIFAKGDEKSFEYMKRKDNLYKYGIVVGHNEQAKMQRGSCIFIHIQRGKNIPTVGCTSMKEKDLLKVIQWLDKTKHPILIQIPKSSANEIKELYPSLISSKLLKHNTEYIGAEKNYFTSTEYRSCIKDTFSTDNVVKCMNKELKKQDAILNKNYSIAMKSIQKFRRNDLKKMQRAWIKYRDLKCSFYYHRKSGSGGLEDSEYCLIQETIKRADELKNIQ